MADAAARGGGRGKSPAAALQVGDRQAHASHRPSRAAASSSRRTRLSPERHRGTAGLLVPVPGERRSRNCRDLVKGGGGAWQPPLGWRRGAEELLPDEHAGGEGFSGARRPAAEAWACGWRRRERAGTAADQAWAEAWGSVDGARTSVRTAATGR